MSWEMWLSVLLLVSMTFDISTGDDFDNCQKFEQIPKEDYDTKPSALQDLSRRPLGFKSAVIPFVTNDPNAKNPCFVLSLNNSQFQTVEMLAESAVGSSSFCVENDIPKSQPTCQSGIKTCSDSAIGRDTIKYVFYCNGCETELTIWFRLTVSPSFSNGLDFEDWCQRDVEYPSSLIVLPNPPDITTTPTSKANLASLNTFHLLVTVTALVLLLS